MPNAAEHKIARVYGTGGSLTALRDRTQEGESSARIRPA